MSAMDAEEGYTLSAVRAGQHGIVRGLRGGHAFCSRAANLGFTAGTQIHVIQNYGSGPMLVAVRGTRVALGRAEAHNVLIDVSVTGSER